LSGEEEALYRNLGCELDSHPGQLPDMRREKEIDNLLRSCLPLEEKLLKSERTAGGRKRGKD